MCVPQGEPDGNRHGRVEQDFAERDGHDRGSDDGRLGARRSEITLSRLSAEAEEGANPPAAHAQPGPPTALQAGREIAVVKEELQVANGNCGGAGAIAVPRRIGQLDALLGDDAVAQGVAS
ncbi:MAG: hypothetical protein LH477_14955 [Nocardioides sp.]|nr:hypothetical protein [Nocardioides sp.]